MALPHTDRLTGLILGTAVGDALGLPAEGLTPSAIRRLGWAGNWRHRLLPGRGMWSDDTEHTIMLGQALARSGGEPESFARAMAWELRWWLLGIPAGIGLATLRSIVKLWMGYPPRCSGVFSAGNGPCMRAALIGACYPNDEQRRSILTAAHTRLTHTDPKALTAARAVTEMAALLCRADQPPEPADVLGLIDHPAADAEWKSILSELREAIDKGQQLEMLLEKIGGNPSRGIGGYAYHTVPAVVFLGMVNRWDFRSTLSAVMDAGGDTDSTGAIAGALCGAFGGRRAIPEEWLAGIREWPVGVFDLERLAESLAEGRVQRFRAYWSPALMIRNLFFTGAVLGHGLLRLVPCCLRRSSTPKTS